jgi:two-component sensor histidine kinase
MGELNHRVNNSLALVLAIMELTWRATVAAGLSAERFREDYTRRLRLLARAQDILIRNDWHGGALADIVRDAVT